MIGRRRRRTLIVAAGSSVFLFVGNDTLTAEGKQLLCPSSAIDDSALALCRDWDDRHSSRSHEMSITASGTHNIWAHTPNSDAAATASGKSYDCEGDEYLRSLAPGKHEGVVANYLSFNTAQSTGHFVDRARLFERCTGGVINFAEANDVAEDPIKDIGTKSSTGSELYDAYIMMYSFTSEASSLGLLETLNDRIRDSNRLLKYEDIFPKVRSMGEYRKDGKTNIDLLMADGDFFVPVVRIDLLERDNKPIPHTWDDVVELARYYNGTDLNDDGVADDFGLCIFPRAGSGFYDAWIPELVYSTWATTDQTKGIQQGFFFDEETFEPRIGNGFERAMNIWKDLWGNSADGCITNNFVSGRCAIGLAPPGCWKGAFVNNEEGGVAWRDGDTWDVLKDENGEPLWRPTMKDGSYAEPYRLKPFGSLEVVNRDTDEFEDCAPETCPKGEQIKSNSLLAPEDRARVLVESPHVGKLINRVPFYWSGGFGTGIRKSADESAKDLMWDFFAYVNSPITSVGDVVIPSWLDSWRWSQLSSYEKNFGPGGWSLTAFSEHKRVMEWALGNEVNAALTLRLPGVLTYTRDVVLGKFLEYMSGSTDIEEVKAHVTQGWNDATATRGKLSQVQIYRASLGLDPLSEFDLCRLHRKEMDDEDITVCAKYDEKNQWTYEDAPAYTSTAIVALALGALAILITTGTASAVLCGFRKGSIKAQIEFLGLLLFGLLLVSTGSLLMALEPSEGTCIASMWMINVGYTAELVPTIMRVSAIINIVSASKKLRVNVDRKVLITKSVALSLVAAVYCALWTGLDPPVPKLGTKTDVGERTVTFAKYCDSESSIWIIVSLTLQGFLLICATVLAYQMRSVPPVVNDSRELAVMIYSSFIFLVLRFAVYLISLVDESLGRNELQAARSIFCSMDSIANVLIFFPKVLRGDNKKRHSAIYISGLSFRRNTTNLTSLDQTRATMVSSGPRKNRQGSIESLGPRKNRQGSMESLGPWKTRQASMETAGLDHSVGPPEEVVIDAEEEKNDEDSDMVTFRTSDRLIAFPKWVVEKYSTSETNGI